MISPAHKFIYTKISKAASSSITATLMKGKHPHFNPGHTHILDDIDQHTKDYFKFTFVRNPWARCVSRYFYLQQRTTLVCKNYLGGNSTFAEFAKSKGPPYDRGEKRKFYVGATKQMKGRSPKLAILFAQKHPWDNQLDWISDENGVVLTDYIGRVENLQEDFNTVCDKIGIPRKELPHRNKSAHKHYTEYYDEESKQIVAEKYAKDIEYFGYEFGA